MSIFDKFKHMLFDEDEVEVPVRSDELPEHQQKKELKEEKKEKGTGFIEYHHEEDIKEDNPIKEVHVPEEEIKEIKEVKKNIFADESDFEPVPSRTTNYDNFDLFEEEEIKSKVIPTNFKEEEKPIHKEIRDYRKMLTDERSNELEKKPFINSPVISPVWGVLDKNYKPEEIAERTDFVTKVNTGVIPRTYGPVSYNDQPLPLKKVKKQEQKEVKEKLVELNTSISEMMNEETEKEIKKEEIKEEVKEEVKEETKEIPLVEDENINTFESAIEEVSNEEIIPTHSIDDIEEVNDDEIIATDNYEDLDDFAISSESIEPDEFEHTNIEDAFDSTSELNEVIEEDKKVEESKRKKKEEEPVVDINSIVEKPEIEEDDDNLDNTIETDLFNLIDSMYKDNEEE